MRLPPPGHPRRVLSLLALFVGLSLLTRWLSLVVEILDTDEAAHTVGSWVLLDGGRLYTDFVDNKPPLLYVYYAFSQVLSGRGLMAVHALTAFVTVPMTALGASAVFRHDRRGLVAGLLYLIYGSAFLAHDMVAAHAELILLLPAAWAIALVSDEARAARPMVLLSAGLLLGLATLVKHQAVFWLPALALAAVRTGDGVGATRVRRAVALGAGFALPLAATFAAFEATGGAAEMLHWLVWRNVSYAANPIPPREALERAAGFLLPWLLATTPLWWTWIRSRPLLDRHLRPLVDGLVVFGLLAAFAGLRFFPHYFVPTVLALAIGAAPAAAAWLRRPLGREGRILVAATVGLALGFQIVNAWLYLGGSRVYRETDPVYRATVARLAADACFPGSRIFVWGWAPAFYYEAGLLGARPASRFAVLAQAGLTGYVSGNLASARGGAAGPPDPVPAHWDLLMGDLERSRATYILDTAPAGIYRWNRYPLRNYPRLDGYVRENYEALDTVGDVQIFRRRDCRAEARSGENRGR